MYFATYKGTSIEYLIVILLVCLSGNQAFTAEDRSDQVVIGMFIVLAILLLMRKRSVLTVTCVTAGFLFLTILLVQSVSFSFLPFVTIAGFMIRLFIGYGAVSLVENFPRVYINVLFYTCIVSLFFYVPEQLFNAVGYDFKLLFKPVREWVRAGSDFNILVYNFENRRELHRNAGFFWEPGAFAGYILLGLTFLGLQRDSYTAGFYWSRLVMMTITLLTTLSTMGFLVLPVVLALHYRPVGETAVARLGWFATVILFLPFLGLGAVKIWNLEMMERKITASYEETVTRSGTWDNSRLGNMVFDWAYIKRRPILGWGLHDKTRLALHANVYVSRGKGNGLSGFIRSFGFLGMGIFVFFAGRGLYKLSGNNLLRSSLAMLAVLLSLNGEQFLNYPLYIGLMFLQKLPEKKREGPERKNDPMDLSHSGAPTNRAGL